jgi:hypothetical protein
MDSEHPGYIKGSPAGQESIMTRRDVLRAALAASPPWLDPWPCIRAGAAGVLAMGGLTVQVERCRHLDHTGDLAVWGYLDPATLPRRVLLRVVPGDPRSVCDVVEAVLRGHGRPFLLRFRDGRHVAGTQGWVSAVVPFVRGDLRPGLLDVAGLPLRLRRAP